MFPLLGLLIDKLAVPALKEAAGAAYEAVTGDKLAPDTSAGDLADKVQDLPPEQQAAIFKATIDKEVALARIDADQQQALTKGSAEWVRATARPEIALRAMKSIQLVVYGFAWLIGATVLQWAIETAAVLASGNPVDVPSVWALVAQVKDAWDFVAVSFVAGFGACVSIVRRYMAARERDKAQEYELKAGQPLQASGAVEAAAGGLVKAAVNAIRGK